MRVTSTTSSTYGQSGRSKPSGQGKNGGSGCRDNRVGCVGLRGGQIPGSSAQNEHSIKTADKLAETHGVSRETIKRDAAFAEAVDALDAGAVLRAECDENVCRKDLSILEALALGERLEKIEGPAAKERQRLSPGRGKKVGKVSTPFEEGKTRDKVANALGMSGKKYEKARTALGGSPRPFEAGKGSNTTRAAKRDPGASGACQAQR